MIELLGKILPLIIVISVFDMGLFFISYIYSRFVFNNYLKKYHRKKWEELVYTEPHGFNWLYSDITEQMRKFRESNEDLGDVKLQKIRKISIYFFKVSIWGWLSLLAIFILIGVIFLIHGSI